MQFRACMKVARLYRELEPLKNKDLLIEMYINGWITLEELEEQLEKLDNDNMPEPPTIY